MKHQTYKHHTLSQIAPYLSRVVVCFRCCFLLASCGSISDRRHFSFGRTCICLAAGAFCWFRFSLVSVRFGSVLVGFGSHPTNKQNKHPTQNQKHTHTHTFGCSVVRLFGCSTVVRGSRVCASERGHSALMFPVPGSSFAC